MTRPVVAFEREDAIAILRIERPERLNALTGGVIDELSAAFKQVEKDDSCRVVLLCGAPRPDGRPCFSAGVDLKAAEAGDVPSGGLALTTRIDDLWKPSIAVIDGICTTGALELAMACDLRLVGESAEISDWHLGRLGSGLGGWGASTRLPRLVGLANAKDMMLTGKVVGGDEAVRIGLANRVYPSERLWDEAMTMARTIAQLPPAGVRETMTYLARTADLSKEESLAFVKHVREWSATTRDFSQSAKDVLAKERGKR